MFYTFVFLWVTNVLCVTVTVQSTILNSYENFKTRESNTSFPEFFRPTWLEIELDQVLYNAKQLKKYIGDEVHLMAVVKANAYEYGDVEISETAILGGATWLGVGTLDEGLHLRVQLSQDIPILVLGYVSTNDLQLASRHRITLTGISLEWIQEAAEVAQEPFDFHLKIDTGLNRLGIRTFDELQSVAEIVSNNTFLNWTGAYTHFATSEYVNNKTFFYQQLDLFNEFLDIIPDRDNKIMHIANSGAILLHTEKPVFDMVRVGLALYGVFTPNSTLIPQQRIRKSLYSTLVLVKKVGAGESIGYGQGYITEREQWIGTVPLGNLDGWGNFNTSAVIIEGKTAPIVGSISIDILMVALPKEYPVGTRVTFIETTWRSVVVSNRLPRVYLYNNTIVSIRNPLMESINLP